MHLDTPVPSIYRQDMTKALTILPADKLPKSLAALEPMQRDFVQFYLEGGGTNATVAAYRAGYGSESETEAKRTAACKAAGYRLTHNPKVQAAIRETAAARLGSGALLGVETVMKIARDDSHKDQFKAAVELMRQSGFLVMTEHKVIVEDMRQSQAEKLAEVKRLALTLGLDPVKLLGTLAQEPVDAEFTVVDTEVRISAEDTGNRIEEDEWTWEPE